jgi:predicted ATPase
MPISSIVIENFKGVKTRQKFKVRPLTIFCGPNSSGKSSCIHAIAALGQTYKLNAAQMPIILDDEYAQVHLGRFLDVIHSKSIKDAFTLGLTIEKPTTMLVRAIKPPKEPPIEIKAEFTFKARASTQEIFVSAATLKMGTKEYTLSRKSSKSLEYDVHLQGKKLSFSAVHVGRLNFPIRPAFKGEKGPSDDQMSAYFLSENVNRNLGDVLRATLYLGPFRQGPLRKYPTRGSQPTEVGAAGEAAVTMLANEYAGSKTKHPKLAKVSAWINALGLGSKIQIQPLAKSDLVDVSIKLKDGAELPLPDLGYGVSQVLPVLVQCAFAPSNATLLFEQPELHLHEGAARKLATVFTDLIREKRNIHIVAETHSKDHFLEVMNEVKIGRIAPEDVILYEVNRIDGKSSFREVNIRRESDGYCEADHPWASELSK